MYQIGDKVVHPLHGAGVIVDIVERTIGGAPATYYALRLALDDTQLSFRWMRARNSYPSGLFPRTGAGVFAAAG